MHTPRWIDPAKPRPAGLARWPCALIALAGITPAIALANDVEMDKPAVDVGINLPLPDAAENAHLRHVLDQEISAMAERPASVAPGIEAGIQALGLDPDDALTVQAAQLEGDALNQVIEGGPAGFEKEPRWGAEGVVADRFAGSSSGDYRSVAGVRMSNGDTVLISVVEFPGQPRQVGFTRRDARGHRKVWPSASATYGHFSNQYLLWPSSAPSPPSVFSVHDAAQHGGRIYALVTANVSGQYLPAIVAFREDGSFAGWWFASRGSAAIQDAVAMDISGDAMVVLARNALGDSTGGFWTWRATLDAGGAPQSSVITNYPTPYQDNNRTGPVDIAFRRTSLLPLSNPSYYVLANYKFSADTNSTDHDPILIAINYSGTLDTGFGSGGVMRRPFDQPSSTSRDLATGLSVRVVSRFVGGVLQQVEDIFVLVNVPRSTRDGFGVWKLRARAEDAAFGSSGRTVYGGCGTTGGEGCAPTPPLIGVAKHHVPADIAVSGDSVGIAGHQDGGSSGVIFGSGVYPTLAVLNATSGALEHLSSHSAGTGLGQGRFLHLLAHSADDFVAGGWAYSTIAPDNETMIATRLIREGELIFRNGFECAAGRPGC